MKLGTLDFVFVLVQVVLFAAYLLEYPDFLFQLNSVLRMIGLGICIVSAVVGVLSLLQLRENLSPFPSPKDGSELITSGVYRFVRHPIYTAIILGLSGFAFYKGSGYKLTVTVLLLILFYFKSSYEERLLEKKFSDYREYKRKTGRFFPNKFLV